MNILVTGSKGFIGKHLIRELERRGHTVIGVDKKDGQDISKGCMEKVVSDLDENLDMIVHLAANCSTVRSVDNPEGDFNDNVRATFLIAELSRKLNIPVIFTSSCKIHSNKEGIRTPYGLSKYVGELYLKEYNKVYGINFIINRPNTIYGSGQECSPESGWISWFVKAKKENLPITIFGDGKQVRSVLFVKDYVDLLVDQVENFDEYSRFEPYEVCGGLENEITILEGLEFLKYKSHNFEKERIGDVKKFIADNTEISKVRGWKPLINWKDGLNQTLDSYIVSKYQTKISEKEKW